MTRTTRTFAIAALALAACLSFASTTLAQSGAAKARTTVELNAERILFFAHPTVTLKGTPDYLGTFRTSDGKNAVGFTFRFVTFFGNDGWTRLYFVHGEMGSIQRIDNGGTSGLIQPFFASNTAINWVKSYLLENEELKRNPLIVDAIERADAKGILLLLLP